MTDAHITADRSLEILVALADYHGIYRAPLRDLLHKLIRTTEQATIRAFYKEFPSCVCPTDAILLCIIEELRK